MKNNVCMYKHNWSFWVDRHMEVLGERCAQKGHGGSTLLPTYLALSFYNKLVI